MRLLLLISLISFSFSGFSQYTQEDNTQSEKANADYKPKSDWRLGGNFQLSINNLVGYVELTPVAMKDLNKNFFIYGGPLFTFLKFKTQNSSITQYGISLGGGKKIRDMVRIEANPILAIQRLNTPNRATETFLVPQFWVGAAANIGGAYIGLYFDLIEDRNTIYSSPILRVGFGF